MLGALLAVAVLRAAPGDLLPVALVAGATGALVVWIVWQDLATFTISDAALLAVAALGFAFRWSSAAADGEAPWHALAAIALDVGLCGGMLLLFREAYYRLKGVDGLGLGDVKLAAAGALLVGGVGFSWALFAASLAGLAAVGAARLLRPGHPQRGPARLRCGAGAGGLGGLADRAGAAPGGDLSRCRPSATRRSTPAAAA